MGEDLLAAGSSFSTGCLAGMGSNVSAAGGVLYIRPVILKVFFMMRSAGTGGGNGSSSIIRDGSSGDTGEVGGEGGIATCSANMRGESTGEESAREQGI